MPDIKHAKRKGGRPSNGKPWEPDERDMEIYAKVCGGQSLGEVGKLYDLTAPRIHVIVHRIDGWLAPQLMEQIREIKANHTARLMHVYTEAMKEWERSKLPGMTVMKKKIGHGQFPGTDLTNSKEYQTGNPSFLSEARAALKQIREIWGADAPLQIEHSGEVRVAGRDVSEARSELLERIQKLTEASNN